MDRVEKNNHISILDDDCLIEIFSYMNYEDICNIEQVSKHWMQLVQKCLLLKTRIYWKSFMPPDKVFKKEDLIEITRRCRNLRTTKDMYYIFEFDDTALLILGKFCPHLNEFISLSPQFSDVGLQILSKNCKEIKLVRLGFSQKYTDIGLTSLLQANPKVDSLGILLNSKINGKFLEHLGRHLRQLFLISYFEEQPFLNPKIGQRFPHLTALKLDEHLGINDNDLLEICNNCQGLTQLTLVLRSLQIITSKGLKYIHRLKKLEALSLWNTYESFTDEMLITIIKECVNLKKLQIPQNESITDYSLKFCRRIKSLDVTRVKKITDESICTLANEGILERVDAFHCQSVSTLAWMKLVECCSKLQTLGISCYEDSWKNIIDVAVKQVEKRDDGPELNLLLDNLVTNMAFPVHPLLKINVGLFWMMAPGKGFRTYEIREILPTDHPRRLKRCRWFCCGR